jgi:hypothetical protein
MAVIQPGIDHRQDDIVETCRNILDGRGLDLRQLVLLSPV